MAVWYCSFLLQLALSIPKSKHTYGLQAYIHAFAFTTLFLWPWAFPHESASETTVLEIQIPSQNGRYRVMGRILFICILLVKGFPVALGRTEIKIHG